VKKLINLNLWFLHKRRYLSLTLSSSLSSSITIFGAFFTGLRSKYVKPYGKNEKGAKILDRKKNIRNNLLKEISGEKEEKKTQLNSAL